MSPNLPILSVLADFTATSGPPSGLSSAAVALDSGDGRTVSRVSTTRGRSYELSGSQSATAQVTVDDPEETLNPKNLASPFNSGAHKLDLYRSIGLRAWWPREGNTLTAANYPESPNWDPGFEDPAGVNGWSTVQGVIENVTTSPWQGTRCARFTLNGPTATPLSFYLLTLPSRVQTYSVYVRVGTVGVSVRLLGPGGATSASTTSSSWTRLVLPFTATVGRTQIQMEVTGGASGVGTQVVYLDGEQLEFGPSATPWVATGPVRKPVWTGYIERLPQEWINNGFRGVRPLECVDSLAVLSRTIVNWTYTSTIEPDAPDLWLPLNDGAGPPIPGGPLGAIIDMASFVASKGGTIDWGGADLPDGDKAVVLTQQLQNPADLDLELQTTSIDSRSRTTDLSPAEFIFDSDGASFECWIRPDASVFRVGVQSVRTSTGKWQGAHGLAAAGDTFVGLSYFNTNLIFAGISSGGGGGGMSNTGLYPDGKWHHVVVALRRSTSNIGNIAMTLWVDGLTATVENTGYVTQNFPINSVTIGVRTPYGDPVSKIAIGRVAVYGKYLDAATVMRHYRRGSGWVGEDSADRARRLLDTFWGGLYTVHPGSGMTMAADHDYNGKSVLSALEEIAASDSGQVTTAVSGEPVVESRITRHATTAASVTFGEDFAGGEVPYSGLSYDYDPNYVYSQVSLTRPGRQDPIVLFDQAVKDVVGERVYSATLAVATDYELEQAAVALLHRYGQARMRVRSVTVRGDWCPELWPTLLDLDISDRVRVRRRTAIGLTLDDEFYVESVRHEVDVEASTWSIAFELSPVFLPQTWICGDTTSGVLGETAVPAY